MRKSSIMFCAALVLAAVAVAPAFAQDDPIAVLNSNADFAAKAEACRVLSIHGKADAIPALKSMLLDEKLAHIARYALEPMPYPEAGAALREALGKANGRVKIGIMSSLANRKDEQAVPEMIKALGDKDAGVAQAAAEALGKLATPEAVKAIDGAIGKANGGNTVWFYDALMKAAEVMDAKGQRDQALAIYDRLLKLANAPAQTHAAALRGAVLARGGAEGTAQLVDAVKSGDADVFNASLGIARELKGKDVTAALAAQVAPLPADRKVQLIAVLGDREGDVAGPALLAEAKDGPTAVRVAAIRALTRLGHAPVLDVVKPLIKSEDADLAKAARNSLSYFPGDAGDALLKAMLEDQDGATRCAAVEMIGEGGLDAPVDILMKFAESDADENVRVAALKGVKDLATVNEMPRLIDRLLKASSQPEIQGAQKALETLCKREQKNANAPVQPAVVDAFTVALGQAQGEAKLAMLQLLRATGAGKALDAVRAESLGEGAVKEAALRAMCDWPASNALPYVMDLAKKSTDETIKVLALRGSVRMLEQSAAETDGKGVSEKYAEIMALAATPDEKKMVLGSLGQVKNAGALEQALRQMGDESVKAEATQAALTIAKNLGKSAKEDEAFFNGKDLAGWNGDSKYWRFEDGVIVGQSDGTMDRNQFIWSNVEVGDFYMVVDMKIEPETGNGGIQFRSSKVDEVGQALGYQADAGKDVWGRLYHEHGRGKLDWNDRADKAVKPGDWNRYEILAVGPAIWFAVNGQLSVACMDLDKNERSGGVAFQLHAGQPMTNRYRVVKLVHNPKVQMEGIPTEKLMRELKKLETGN